MLIAHSFDSCSIYVYYMISYYLQIKCLRGGNAFFEFRYKPELMKNAQILRKYNFKSLQQTVR